MTLRLFSFGPASNSLKPLLTLYEKALPFEHCLIDGAKFEQHADWFTALNPQGQVPVLDHDGRIVTESTVICEYLEDAFPGSGASLRPADSHARARMRIWAKWVDDVLWPNLSILSWSELIPRITGDLSDAQFEARMDAVPVLARREKWRAARRGFEAGTLNAASGQLAAAVGQLERGLREADWLVGEQYSLADICVFSSAAGLDGAFPQLVNAKATPALMRWLLGMRDRDAVKGMYADAAGAR